MKDLNNTNFDNPWEYDMEDIAPISVLPCDVCPDKDNFEKCKDCKYLSEGIDLCR